VCVEADMNDFQRYKMKEMTQLGTMTNSRKEHCAWFTALLFYVSNKKRQASMGS